MKVEVATAIDEVKRQFPDSPVTVREDGQGGAFVILESVTLGPKYIPTQTWFGFHVPAQIPYADIYPFFMGAEVRRADGVAFANPITTGHHFEGRPAIQISRRNSAANAGTQRVVAKILKILVFLEGVAA